jgi:hypothetical protein
MSTEAGSSQDPTEDRDVAPLGSVISDPPGDDEADGMAGPVFPPPETEPDAQRNRPARGA